MFRRYQWKVGKSTYVRNNDSFPYFLETQVVSKYKEHVQQVAGKRGKVDRVKIKTFRACHPDFGDYEWAYSEPLKLRLAGAGEN